MVIKINKSNRCECECDEDEGCTRNSQSRSKRRRRSSKSRTWNNETSYYLERNNRIETGNSSEAMMEMQSGICCSYPNGSTTTTSTRTCKTCHCCESVKCVRKYQSDIGSGGHNQHSSNNPVLNLTIPKWLWRIWRWKVNYKFNCFVILFLTFTSLFHNHPVQSLPIATGKLPVKLLYTSQMQMRISHSQNSGGCDWTGRGTTATNMTKTSTTSLVQTVTLRCTRGTIHWEQPKAGLKVTISPNIGKPYKLCLENVGGRRRHRILLEETEIGYSTSGGQVQAQKKLLSILTRSNSNCYRIQDSSAVLYIESHGETQTVMATTTESTTLYLNSGDGYLKDFGAFNADVPSSDGSSTNTILISYEIESLRGDGDPCRPCTESEVLQTFCSSDVVARGSILQVQTGKKYDSIYIRSDLVLHQNQPVFTPFQDMEKFLNKKAIRFDMDKPQRFSVPNKGQSQSYGGIVSHPSTCSSSVGPGDFLWLIKFRFGIPLVDCVIYWDKWVHIANTRQGECPLRTN